MEKRQSIEANFNEHVKSIEQSLSDEKAQLLVTETEAYTNEQGEEKSREVTYENDILRENAQLERKFTDLVAEIEEKSALMDQQIAEK